MTKPTAKDKLDQAAAAEGWTPGIRRTWGLAYRRGDEQIDVNLDGGRFSAARHTTVGQPPRRLARLGDTLDTMHRKDQP